MHRKLFMRYAIKDSSNSSSSSSSSNRDGSSQRSGGGFPASLIAVSMLAFQFSLLNLAHRVLSERTH